MGGSLTEEQIQQYFHRIQLPEALASSREPTLELLCAIQWGHCSHICYENLTCVHPKAARTSGSKVSLAVNDLFEKMVLHRRHAAYDTLAVSQGQ